jgi:hypothetical protein
MPSARVSWSSSDPRVATVDQKSGTVRAVSAGGARITARVGSVVSAVMVTVVPPAPDPTIVATVEVSEARPLSVGETIRLSAIVRNAAGAPLSNAVEWSSSNTDVASVAPSGLVSARGPGVTTIRATAGDRSGERSVTVRAREVVTRPDTPAATTTTRPTKSEADLRAEIQAVFATYVSAIERRDTSLIRRIYPNADAQSMKSWQALFNDARGPIQVVGRPPDIVGTPRDADGSQVQARARYSVRFVPPGSRSQQASEVAFTAVVQRDGGAWRIASIR